MSRRIPVARMPRHDTDAEFARYFRDLRVEHADRARRLENYLLRGGMDGSSAPKGLRHQSVGHPIWELEDVCCMTTLSRDQLHELLLPLWEVTRRYGRVSTAAWGARYVRKQERLALAEAGDLEAMLDRYLREPKVVDGTDEMIDRWLAPMFEPCRFWRSHDARRCRKPAPWTRADMGGSPETRPRLRLVSRGDRGSPDDSDLC